MAKAGILLGIICSIAICCGWGAGGGGVRSGERIRVLNIARAEVGVREVTGKNDGKRVEEYLTYVGFKKGNPYCSAYISWVFGQAGYDQPRTAWSPSLFPASRLTKDALPGDVFGIYYESLKRIGHCGILEHVKGEWCTTLEGNSNNNGNRNGDGVYRRLRHKKTIYRYANWLKQ